MEFNAEMRRRPQTFLTVVFMLLCHCVDPLWKVGVALCRRHTYTHSHQWLDVLEVHHQRCCLLTVPIFPAVLADATFLDTVLLF